MLNVTILPDAIRRRGPWSLPNLLTYGRILAIPALVAILFWPRDDWMRWLALAIYTLAAITDYLDGYIARAWSQQSAIGRMLDPIADKLLVCALLLMLVADGTIHGWTLWAAIVILCREILVSGLREFLADLKLSVPVSKVAKWKSTAQLFALGFLCMFTCGGISRWCSESTTLIRPAMPAADSRCPMLVLIEPTSRSPSRSPARPSTASRARSSIGSPSAVPVPCAST